MSAFLGLVVAGAVSGALYAMMASGLVLTYTTSGVFNFAHGAIAYVAALIYFELNSGAHLPIVPSAIIAICIFSPLCGLALDRIMFRRLAQAGSTAQIVATVGLLIALPALGVWIVERLIAVVKVNIPSPDNVVTPPGIGPEPASSFHLVGSASINTDQIAALAAAAVVALGLWLIVGHTSLGLRMRATVGQRQLASLRGVNPDRTSGVAWALGSMLAGLTGVLGAPILNLGSSDFTLLMLVSAAAAVFARLRSIPIAFIAGIALGVIQDLVAGYVNPRLNLNGFSSSVPFMLLFIGLLVLDRRRGARARVPTEEKAPPTYDADLSSWRRGAPWAVGVVVLIIYTLFVANTFWVGVVTAGLCVTIILLSFIVVTGIGGMISLAQATFVMVAALTVGILVGHHVNYFLALLAGTAAATVVGAFVALPALRLGGVPLALATLALGYIGDLLVYQINAVSNSSLGWVIKRPSIGPLNLASNKTMAMCVLALVGLIVLAIRNLRGSATGRAIFSVRSSEIAAEASGISSVRTKLVIFSISAAIAGFGGALYATYSGSITGADFPTETGLLWLAIMVTFGVRRPGYAVIAGLVYTIFPQVLSWVTTSTVVPQILFGLGGISLARSPDGFLAEYKLKAFQRRTRKREKLVGTQVVTPLPTDRSDSLPPAGIPLPDRGARHVNGSDRAAGEESARPGSRIVSLRNSPESEPDTTKGSPVLELRDIRAGYDSAEALHGISLALYPGVAFGLLGANGAGKSTTCSIAGGLLSPFSGTVLLDGADITTQPPYWRNRHGVVLVPEARSVFPNLTVDENLRILLPTGQSRDAVYDRFGNLAMRRKLAAGLLSGGEQRILALAPLLAEPPRVLIADEPSLGLAPQVVADVFRLFDELRSAGVALLVVEEKLRDIRAFADTLAIMEVGEIEWTGESKGLSDEDLAVRYLHAAP